MPAYPPFFCCAILYNRDNIAAFEEEVPGMATTDDPGQPELAAQQAEQQQNQQQQQAVPALDAEQHPGEQAVSVNTAQAAKQLGVDGRTVRRWITDGLHTAGGAILRLKARQVRNARGPEYQIYQHDLEEFKQERDRLATEGQDAGQLAAQQESQSQAVTLSYQIISAELERRDKALIEAQKTITEAQATIERLALQAGRDAGRNEALELQLKLLQERVTELTTERDHWRQKAGRQKLYRIQLFPIESED
jgi:hypothetical protein